MGAAAPSPLVHTDLATLAALAVCARAATHGAGRGHARRARALPECAARRARVRRALRAAATRGGPRRRVASRGRSRRLSAGEGAIIGRACVSAVATQSRAGDGPGRAGDKVTVGAEDGPSSTPSVGPSGRCPGGRSRRVSGRFLSEALGRSGACRGHSSGNGRAAAPARRPVQRHHPGRGRHAASTDQELRPRKTLLPIKGRTTLDRWVAPSSRSGARA
jgi:hypothetical protein